MKPILFNTDMVRALLDGRKTVTRRVIKPQPEGAVLAALNSGEESRKTLTAACAPYQAGDILYVRETWAMQQGLYWHKAGLKIEGNGRAYGVLPPEKWRPSILMPKEAARIFLRVTDVRVERLQDMTDEQCARDGGYAIEAVKAVGVAALFAPLWDSTIKKPADRELYGWAADPWAWVISFERISREEAEGK